MQYDYLFSNKNLFIKILYQRRSEEFFYYNFNGEFNYIWVNLWFLLYLIDKLVAFNIIFTINFNPYSTGDPKPLLPEIFKIPYQVDIFYMIFWKRDVEWRWKLSLLEIFIRFFSKMFFTKCKKNVIFLQRICAITMLKSLIYILKMVYSVSSQLNYVYYTSCEKAL